MTDHTTDVKNGRPGGQDIDARLQEALEGPIAALVRGDHGTIGWIRRDGSIVRIRMGGACAGCPGQPITLRAVVLPALQAIDPSVQQVQVVLDLGDD